MANTRYLTTKVEDHVRKVLGERFGTPFRKRVLDPTTGGRHDFDAVSDDGTIVASIKATSGKTAGGKISNGKYNNAITEIYLFIACRSTAANARAYVPIFPLTWLNFCRSDQSTWPKSTPMPKARRPSCRLATGTARVRG